MNGKERNGEGGGGERQSQTEREREGKLTCKESLEGDCDVEGSTRIPEECSVARGIGGRRGSRGRRARHQNLLERI